MIQSYFRINIYENAIIKGVINKKLNSYSIKFYHIISVNLKECPFIIS